MCNLTEIGLSECNEVNYINNKFSIQNGLLYKNDYLIGKIMKQDIEFKENGRPIMTIDYIAISSNEYINGSKQHINVFSK